MRSLLKFIAICCLLCLSCAWAHAVEDRPFRSGFGLVVKFGQGQPISQIDRLSELGVSWVRDGVYWHTMEPKAGEYQPFPEAFQARLEKYKEAGIGVLYILAYANGKAYPASPENPLAPIDPVALGKYAVHIAKLLKKSGVKFAIQVWNEPHNYQIKAMVGGAWNGVPPSPWVDHYLKMVNEVHQQVKAIAPDVTVIDCEDVWPNHYWFAASGKLPKSFDGIGLHAYTNETSSGPEVVSPTFDSDWTKPFQVVDRDRSFGSAIERLRVFTGKYTGKKPDVWITEWGWKLDSKFANGSIDEELVAAFLPRAYVLAEAAGVKALFWFSMYDAVDGAYGLISNKGRERAAYRSYKTMNRMLGDYTLRQRLSAPDRVTTGVQAYLFENGKNHRLIVWNADNKTVMFRLPINWRGAEVFDLYGDTVAPIRSGDGATQYEVGASPIYIQVEGSRSISWAEDFVSER